MTINPVYLLLGIYFFSNFYAFVTALANQGFYAFNNYYKISNGELVLAFVLQFFSFVVLLLFFNGSYKRYRNRIIELGSGWGGGLLILITSFFIFNQVFGSGLAGSGFKFEDRNLLNYFFVIIQPDIWFFLIAPHLKSSRQFCWCAVFYLISLTTRGWMGGVMLIGLMALIRYYPVKLKFKTFFPFFLMGLLVVALLPFLDAFKWGFRSGLTIHELFEIVSAFNYLDVFGVVSQSVIDRFNNYNYVAFAIHEREVFFKELLSGNVNWFFQSGILSNIYCNIFSCGKDIGVFSAELVSGLDELSWNIDIGVSGWLAVLGWASFVYIIFSICLLYFGYFLYGRMGAKGVMVFGVFCFVYFFHGWNGAFVNTIIYAVVFSFLLRMRLRASSAVFHSNRKTTVDKD